MKEKSVFDKILTKKNYTIEEVKELLYGTYEGFTEGWLKNHPKAIIKAKKEVFNDIENLFRKLDKEVYKDKRFHYLLISKDWNDLKKPIKGGE